MKCCVFTCALALAVCFGSGVGLANPLTMFGSGARGASMGSAQTAAARDSSANYYNPALLATLAGLELDFGYRIARPDLRLNGASLGVDTARGSELAVGMPGRVGAIRLGVGVAVYLPDQQLMRIRSLRQEQPRFALYDNRAQRLFLAVNFGVSIGDKLSIGGGLGYLTQTSGGVTLKGRVGFPNAEDSDLRLDMDVDVSTHAYPLLGIAYQLRPWLRIAAAYRGGVQPVSDLSIRIEGDIGAANRDPIVEDALVNLRSLSLSHFQPAEISLGFDAQLSPRLSLAGDLALHRWSDFANPASRIESEIRLGDFDEFLTPPAPALLARVSYHDILIPRIGMEWLLREGPMTSVHARAGYSYEASPAPEQIGATNFVDNDKHTGSLGAGLSLRDVSEIFPKPVSIDGSAALTALTPREHRKLSPIDPTGDYRSSGSIYQFLITARFRL